MFKIPIVENLIPNGRKNRPGIIVTKKYITVHETGNFNRGADALSHGNYLKTTPAAQKPVSWAYSVDDKRIVKHLPITEMAYHAGDGYYGTGNRESIGIEICCHKGINQEKAYRNAAWLVAHLQAEVPTLLPFPESIRPGNIAGGVAQHNRWNGKNCPSLLRNTPNGWTDFLKQVEEFMESEKMDVSIPYFKFLDIMATAPPPIPYGVKMIGAELEWPETKGKGVKVAVLDTGKPGHPDIKVVGAVDFTGTGIDDKHGHSTHVCGIIAANGKIKGVAPECELYTAKVLNDKGQGSFVWVAQAVRWCIENKMDVISMSLGGSKPADDTLHNALRDAYAAGITNIAAAGNTGEFGKDTVLYPAVYPECLATTAVDVEKKRPEFSSQGVEAELAAAGVDVWSTYLGGNYAQFCGTSMACPHITGAVAIMIAKRRIRGLPVKPDLIRDSMAVYAEDLPPVGWDELHGFGVFTFGRVGGSDRPAIDLRFEIGETKYWKNGVVKQAYIAPRIVDGRTLVGLRDVGEALECQVDWVRPYVYIKSL